MALTPSCNLGETCSASGNADARHTTGARRPPPGRVFPPAAPETAGPCRTARRLGSAGSPWGRLRTTLCRAPQGAPRRPLPGEGRRSAPPRPSLFPKINKNITPAGSCANTGVIQIETFQHQVSRPKRPDRTGLGIITAHRTHRRPNLLQPGIPGDEFQPMRRTGPRAGSGSATRWSPGW